MTRLEEQRYKRRIAKLLKENERLKKQSTNINESLAGQRVSKMHKAFISKLASMVGPARAIASRVEALDRDDDENSNLLWENHSEVLEVLESIFQAYTGDNSAELNYV